VTTQSPHLYERQVRTDAGDPRTGKAAAAQTRLPWWAVALPVLAFAVLLAVLSGGSAHASTAQSGADLIGRLVTVLGDLVGRLL
jgi:hypothetical protein